MKCLHQVSRLNASPVHHVLSTISSEMLSFDAPKAVASLSDAIEGLESIHTSQALSAMSMTDSIVHAAPVEQVCQSIHNVCMDLPVDDMNVSMMELLALAIRSLRATLTALKSTLKVTGQWNPLWEVSDLDDFVVL